MYRFEYEKNFDRARKERFMKSILCKSSVIAAFFIVSNCDNNTTSITTIHPLMNLAQEQQDGASRVIISTTVANNFSMYRIIDDSCTVNYPWSAIKEDGSDSAYVASVKIANDPAAAQSGTFYGIWEVPDSLLIYGSIGIYVCVSDEANHDVCTSFVVRGTASLP
jgi:hypothetical protein